MCLGCMWILCCLCDGSQYQVDLKPNLYMYLYAYIGEWTTIDMTKKKNEISLNVHQQINLEMDHVMFIL